jgi:hypothetical protein
MTMENVETHCPPFFTTESPYFVSENSVGVLPVTCRNACENAGTLA